MFPSFSASIPPVSHSPSRCEARCGELGLFSGPLFVSTASKMPDASPDFPMKYMKIMGFSGEICPLNQPIDPMSSAPGRGFSQRTKELVKELAEELGARAPGTPGPPGTPWNAHGVKRREMPGKSEQKWVRSAC